MKPQEDKVKSRKLQASSGSVYNARGEAFPDVDWAAQGCNYMYHVCATPDGKQGSACSRAYCKRADGSGKLTDFCAGECQPGNPYDTIFTAPHQGSPATASPTPSPTPAPSAAVTAVAGEKPGSIKNAKGEDFPNIDWAARGCTYSYHFCGAPDGTACSRAYCKRADGSGYSDAECFDAGSCQIGSPNEVIFHQPYVNLGGDSQVPAATSSPSASPSAAPVTPVSFFADGYPNVNWAERGCTYSYSFCGMPGAMACSRAYCGKPGFGKTETVCNNEGTCQFTGQPTYLNRPYDASVTAAPSPAPSAAATVLADDDGGKDKNKDKKKKDKKEKKQK